MVWYIGFTEDIQQRIIDHNSGKTFSTSYRRPLEMIYYEAYLEKSDALGRERFLKSGSGYKFLRKQLAHYLAHDALT
jgi:putative endonuclease